MRSVFVRGLGLSCALGTGVDACVAGMRARRTPVQRLALEWRGEPLDVHYYRIDDGAPLQGGGRLAHLVPPVVAAAVVGLTPQQRRELPIFVGSSSFAVARSEALYAAALAAAGSAADRALPMPRAGYQGIADSVRAVTGARGPDFAWNTACASSANALLAARTMLACGAFDQALVLGVELANLTSVCGFSALQMLTDRVRPFDAARSGSVLGEAVGAVLLDVVPGEPRRIRIGGGANHCDTYSITSADPAGHALATVQQRALDAVAAGWREVRAIKAHATGTPANDAGEVRAMQAVYPDMPPVIALKPFIGHTLGACGVAELALLAGALRQNFMPATSGFETVDPELGLVPLERELPAAAGWYQLNHFGFGGNNAVVMLELE